MTNRASPMTLTFLPGDGQKRSNLALFADTPFGTYVIDEGHWFGPDHTTGTCRDNAEAVKAAKADWSRRLLASNGRGK